MQIGPKTVVTFHYTLHDESGTELETSRTSEPTAYLCGANNIIRGLETAMSGKGTGDIFSVTLSPEEAYGLRNPDQAQRVPIKHLVFKGKLQLGDVVQLNTKEGMRCGHCNQSGQTHRRHRHQPPAGRSDPGFQY